MSKVALPLVSPMAALKSNRSIPSVMKPTTATLAVLAPTVTLTA